jgi:hypothetical protein
MPAPITTAITICNSALLKLGADKISALSGSGRASVTCNTLYAYLRDEVMGSHPWKFALFTALLAPTSDTPVNTDWEYSYDIPNDCLRPLGPIDDQISWTVEGSKILCNESTLTFKYIYRNTDESSWDARFCEALAWRLAMELALSVVQSIPMKQEAEKSYDKYLASARAMNGLVGTLPPLEADTWANARRGNRFDPITGNSS